MKEEGKGGGGGGGGRVRNRDEGVIEAAARQCQGALTSFPALRSTFNKSPMSNSPRRVLSKRWNARSSPLFASSVRMVSGNPVRSHTLRQANHGPGGGGDGTISGLKRSEKHVCQRTFAGKGSLAKPENDAIIVLQRTHGCPERRKAMQGKEGKEEDKGMKKTKQWRQDGTKE